MNHKLSLFISSLLFFYETFLRKLGNISLQCDYGTRSVKIRQVQIIEIPIGDGTDDKIIPDLIKVTPRGPPNLICSKISSHLQMLLYMK